MSEVLIEKSLFVKYKSIIDNAIKAVHERKFYAQYPEHPKPYGEEAPKKGLEFFQAIQNNNFEELLQTGTQNFIGEELSPYTQEKLGIKYPQASTQVLISNAKNAFNTWRKVSIQDRAGILVESLERIKNRFFDIAYATMHTTGQSFMMSFQASGPHANDRALEAIALGYQELTRFPNNVEWVKPMGKFDIKLSKSYRPISKGISLVIGCSTFPVWNTVPAVYADLIAGNPVIVKPHPMAILPAAIVVAEIQKVLKENNLDINTVQLSVDTPEKPITKELAEHKEVKVIDYTGNSEFGTYLEGLKGKTIFTEKTGVNSVILDSVNELEPVVQNLAFAVSLYSGQMCTAPQNFFVPKDGVKTKDGSASYDEVVTAIKTAISGLASNPKIGPGTLGAIQNPSTIDRAKKATSIGGKKVLEAGNVPNDEFKNARTSSHTVLEVDAKDKAIFEKELFGPIVLIIKTDNTEQSIQLAKEMAEKHGAITCAAYTTDDKIMSHIEEEMSLAYTPVTFNLTGFIWVNQHAAFSDFHVTGGNPAGNATYVNPEFVTRRFVWVGHRRM